MEHNEDEDFCYVSKLGIFSNEEDFSCADKSLTVGYGVGISSRRQARQAAKREIDAFVRAKDSRS